MTTYPRDLQEESIDQNFNQFAFDVLYDQPDKNAYWVLVEELLDEGVEEESIDSIIEEFANRIYTEHIVSYKPFPLFYHLLADALGSYFRRIN